MATAATAACVLLLCSQFSLAESDVPDANWWAFRQAVKPSIPVDSAWCRNPIDRFIAQQHSAHGIKPAPEASRAVLLRRLTFDLIGLPPTPEELEAFQQDTSTNACEKIVDRLLASPHYGERWARHWLDTVHYGESHGYDKDKPRLNAWPYRDYVIHAFNSDKPYSAFVEEQLAADILRPEQPATVPALGFIAAGPWDFVGHVELPITKTDGLLARYNDRDDMVMNSMSTFQSLTVHCARCHDHKFDPITQRDYYGLQAVFAGVDRADRPYDTDSKVAARRRQLRADLEKLTARRTSLDERVAQLGGDALRDLDAEIKTLRAMKPNKAAFGYHSQISEAQDVQKWVQIDLGNTHEIQEVVFVGCHDDFNNIGAGFGFPLRYKVEVSDNAGFTQGVTFSANRVDRDATNPGVTPQRITVAGKSGRYVRFTATRLAPRKGDFIFALAELMVLDAAGKNLALGASVTALDTIEAPPRWQKKNLTDGYFVGSETNAASEQLIALDARRNELLRARVPASILDEIKSNREAAARLESELKSLPPQQAVYAATHQFKPNGSFVPPAGPRPVHLLRRGEVKRPGDEMAPSAVAAVPGVAATLQIADPSNEAQRRAALARWLTNTNNMLTRRSIVNRIWAYHFGRGIVDTPNDFGRMGGQPSHPDLLDWLAFWFLEQGESIKELHRLIVTSATYRQSSQADAALAADSQNRLLWRMNRTRLDAEQFRDALLAIGGKLDKSMGGPSIQQFGFKDDHSPVYDYARFDLGSPGANRRSIYRFIVRSVPDPFMEALDCPDANILTPTRTVTTTALQALASWNDAFVLRQCENLAARAARERSTLDAQVARCVELCLIRPPGDAELARLVEHARAHGLRSVCRVLFNSNEFMFID